MAPVYHPELANVALTYPAIDNHAHPLLAKRNRLAFPLEGIISEASDDALTHDACYTLASYRATAQLSKLFGLKDREPTWDKLKDKREEMDYVDLCHLCFKPTGIQCILLDDGLGGVAELAESYKWHDQFTTSPSKRIVRIEAEAENILREIIESYSPLASTVSAVGVLEDLQTKFKATILAHAQNEHVVGFKSVICYRTGLDIAPTASASFVETENAVLDLLLQYEKTGSLRLQQKILNDLLVRIALEIAGQFHKPVQFHTGLGDNDIQLAKSSPAQMQPVIKAYPNTPIVILHSSYPYTRDAGYLAAVYKNVYLDFGEVFPFLSGDGQRAVVRQVLELAPTNKILWSTDGHWWPESYYLATVQARQVLYEVLSDSVNREELTEKQAIEIVENALFHNANRIYNLGLEPQTDLL